MKTPRSTVQSFNLRVLRLAQSVLCTPLRWLFQDRNNARGFLHTHARPKSAYLLLIFYPLCLAQVFASTIILLNTAAPIGANGPFIVTYSDQVADGNSLTVTVNIQNYSGTWLFVKQDFPDVLTEVKLTSTAFILGPWWTKSIPNVTFYPNSHLDLKAATAIGVPFDLADPECRAIFGALTVDLMTRGLLSTPLPPSAFDDPFAFAEGIIPPVLEELIRVVRGTLGDLQVDLKSGDLPGIAADLAKLLKDTPEAKDALKTILARSFSADQVDTFIETASSGLEDLVKIIDVLGRGRLLAELATHTFSSVSTGYGGLQARLRVDRPSISSLTPSSITVSSSPQNLTIYGSHFSPATDPNPSMLVFFTPSGTQLPNRSPNFIGAEELRYQPTFPTAGAWSVKVVNGSMESQPYDFYVGSGSTVKQLAGLSISGPATVNENSTATYEATAIFSDGSRESVTPTWTLSGGAPASISSSGQLTAASVSQNTTVTVNARYTAGAVTKTAGYQMSITTGKGGIPELRELVVNGDFANGSSGWTLTGNFQADSRFATCKSCPGYAYLANSDGTSGNNLNGTLSQAIQIPATATSATLGYYYRITTSETKSGVHDLLAVNLVLPDGSLVGLDSKSNVDANSTYGYVTFDVTGYRGKTVTVRFIAGTDGSGPTVFRVDDVSVIAYVPVAPTAVLLGIRGPTSVGENATAQYDGVVVYSDGSVKAPASLTWSVSGPATISPVGGTATLSTGNVNSDTPATITLSYTEGSSTLRLDNAVTVLNVTGPAFSFLAIDGPTSLNENSSAQFTATAIFDDGSRRAVTPGNWSVNPPATMNNGSVSAGEVSSDTVVTVSATATVDGVTRSGTKDVLIVNVVAPPALVSLNIIGPSSANENTTAQYTAVATFSDGSAQIVVPVWTKDLPMVTISDSGLLSAGEVSNDTSVTVSASYTAGGITQTTQKTITVLDAIVTGTYTITVNAANGTVTKNPDRTKYTLNEEVVLRATPATGYEFVNWTGDATGSENPLTVRMTADKNITANFDLVPITSAFQNGSFELPADSPAQYLPSGSTLLPGWVTGGNGGRVYWAAGDGAQGPRHLGFNTGDSPPGSWVSQTFDTELGGKYEVTFYVGRYGYGEISLTASAKSHAGEVLGQLVAVPVDQGWGPVQRFVFTATSSRTTLEFLDTSTQTVKVDITLDGVSVKMQGLQKQLSGMGWSGDVFRFTLNGPPGKTYVVEAASDLIDWVPISTTMIPAAGYVVVTDSGVSTQAKRFYRASAPAAGVATVVADGLSGPGSLVLDGGNIFFADNTPTDGVIKKVSKIGGAVTTLYTGAALFDSSFWRGVGRLQADSSTLYGDYGGYETLNIFSGPETGGSLTTLASVGGGIFLAVIGNDIYYSGGFNSLNRMPKTGGTPSQVASGVWVRGYAYDAGAIYFVDYWTKDLKVYSLASGAVTTLLGGNTGEGSVFVDADNVYYSLNGNILKVAKAGGHVDTLVSSGRALGYVSDGSRVYYVESNAIMSVPVGGGSPATLIADPARSFRNVVTDDAFVYWADGYDGAGKIWRIAKPSP